MFTLSSIKFLNTGMKDRGRWNILEDFDYRADRGAEFALEFVLWNSMASYAAVSYTAQSGNISASGRSIPGNRRGAETRRCQN
jgi:hypothetical protein